MPVPYAPPVTLADEERRQLEALARAHSTPQALAFRCRLILRTAAPDRPPNLRVAVELHCDRHTVRLWRTRYLAQGLAGFRMRRGRGDRGAFPPPDQVDVLSVATAQPAAAPCRATRWSLDDMLIVLRQQHPGWGHESFEPVADFGGSGPQTASQCLLAQ